MYQDYKDLLSAFHAHGVRYLVVGGYAVIFNAQPRFTKDIDPLRFLFAVFPAFLSSRWCLRKSQRRPTMWNPLR